MADKVATVPELQAEVQKLRGLVGELAELLVPVLAGDETTKGIGKALRDLAKDARAS